jgi:hypothetical protein
MFRQLEGRQRPLVEDAVIGDGELSSRSLLLEHGSSSDSNRRIDSCRACQRVQSGREPPMLSLQRHRSLTVDGV